MSKPTMQDIADALSVSRITVWKALSNRPGVSDSMRAQIHQKATEMGYFHTPSQDTTATVSAQLPPHTRTVAVAVCRPESSLFWMQIIHQIAKDLSEHNVNLMYTYLPTNYKAGYVLPQPLTNGTVDGVIVLNTYSAPLLRLLSSLPIPKVFLDTVPSVPYNQLHGDLLIIEGRDLIRQITSNLLRHGCRKLSFIGDVEYAQTNKERYEGFLDALHEHGIIPNPSLYLTGSLGLRTHYEEISHFLDFLPTMPDGIVCASDYIAHFIQRYLEEKGIDPEGRIVLTGFDNNSEYLNVADRITTVDVKPKTIGSRLAAKILFVIEHPKAAPEVSYVSSEVLYRGVLASDPKASNPDESIL